MTERLHFHFSLSCIGEGNGTPLQYSSWRIPGMGEPGGVAQSQTRLKRLSSSSSSSKINTLIYTCAKSLQSCPTLWNIAHQDPLSIWFSRQEYWSRLPYLPPGDLPHPGIEPTSLPSPIVAAGATWH